MGKDVECRVWHRYMTSTYELLSDLNETLQDAGLYNGQVRGWQVVTLVFSMLNVSVQREGG